MFAGTNDIEMAQWKLDKISDININPDNCTNPNNSGDSWNEEDVGFYGLNPKGRMAKTKKGRWTLSRTLIDNTSYDAINSNNTIEWIPIEEMQEEKRKVASKDIESDLKKYEKENNYHMQLHKLLIVNILTYGIPTIPTYIVYEMSNPFIHTQDDFMNQMLGLVFIFVFALVANREIFWENYYHKYLIEEKKEKKNEKNEKQFV